MKGKRSDKKKLEEKVPFASVGLNKTEGNYQNHSRDFLIDWLAEKPLQT